VQVDGSHEGRPLATARARFTVKPKGDTPAIGAPAPRSHNPTRYDVDDIRKIDSGATPNDMHELSVADAIDQGKPLVVLFASPGFCVSQTCAPQLQEVQRLQAEYAPRVNFVHVEIFKDPMTRTPYETVNEWGLQSEPWTFFVDRQGLVAEKLEGPAPYAELKAALQPLL
jgi:Thioredoxin-like domain